MKNDITIIGAGASGLMATKELSAKGYKCCLLEAAATAGGRIETIKENFSQPVETGAEFIHGNLPLTLQLLKEANILSVPVRGSMIVLQNGSPVKQQLPYHEQFIDKANTLINDMTLASFFNQYFAGEQHHFFRDNIQRFAAGFDLADPENVSVFSLRKEWSHEDEEQYRIPEGYSRLIQYLTEKCRENNVAIHFNSVVSSIEYKKDIVTVSTKDGRRFESNKVIITVSAGVLKEKSIQFNPLPQKYLEAIDKLGFGTVIKVLLEFKTQFWKQAYPNTGFFITDETIPTWWTQLPLQNNLLTGWLGGPPASAKSDYSANDLLQPSLQSLASAFRLDKNYLAKELSWHKLINWQNNPHVKGGYSYSTIHSEAAKELLNMPIENTIFFAGEALWKGESQGTVEAALQSGLEASKKIISFFK